MGGMWRPVLPVAVVCLFACGEDEVAPDAPPAPWPPLWSRGTLRPVAVAEWHGGGDVEGIAIAPDRTWFATVLSSGALVVRDMETGDVIHTLARDVKDVYESINNVAIDPRGRWIVTGRVSKDYRGRMGVWDATTGKELHILEGHDGRVRDLVFTADGGRLFTVSRDSVWVWDCATWKGSPLRRREGVRGGGDLALAPDGRSVYVVGAAIERWVLPDGPWEPVGDAYGLPIVLSAGRLFGGLGRGQVEVFDLGERKQERILQLDHRHDEQPRWLRDDYVMGLASSPDGRWLYAATGWLVTVWDTGSWAAADTLSPSPVPTEPTASRYIECLAACEGRLLVGYGSDVLIYEHAAGGK